MSFNISSLGKFNISTGVCSSLSNSYTSNCHYNSIESQLTLDYPFYNCGITNFMLVPTNLILNTTIPTTNISNDPNDFIIIQVKEPTGNVVEVIKVLLIRLMLNLLNLIMLILLNIFHLKNRFHIIMRKRIKDLNKNHLLYPLNW